MAPILAAESSELATADVSEILEARIPLDVELLDPRKFRRTAADLLEQRAYDFGQTYDAYLVNESGRSCFWSRDGQGVVAYVRMGRYLKIGGGLLAAPEHKETLLCELLAFARAERLVLSFYNISEEDLPLFSKCGFQVTKWGEEAVIDLLRDAWQGKAFQWVRRQLSYCRRQGLVVQECHREGLSAAEWTRLMDELQEIAGTLPENKAQREELRFLQGSFDRRLLARKRIFVARSRQGAGRVEAFVVANPADDGRLWVFEVYRHRADAVRGTMPFLMCEAMQRLEQEGVERVSLCLVPGLRCDEARAGDSPLVRHALVWGTRYFSFIFDAAGLYHFKSRFRPRFENRYLCAYPRVTLGSAWAFVRLVNVLDLDYKKCLRIVAQRLRNWTCRTNLAEATTADGDALT